jgi:hypothetical protein
VKQKIYNIYNKILKMNKETLRMQMLSGVITESEYKAKLEEDKGTSFEDLKTLASSFDTFKDMGDSFSFQYDNNSSQTGENISTVTITISPSTDLDKVTMKTSKKSKNPDEYEKLGWFDTHTEDQPIVGVKMWLNSLKRRKFSSLNENFVGMGMVGNIFDREKTDYELAFEHFTKGTSLNEVEEELEEANPLEGGPGYMTKNHAGVLARLISDLESEDTSNFSESNLKNYEEALSNLKTALEATKAKYREETGEDL